MMQSTRYFAEHKTNVNFDIQCDALETSVWGAVLDTEDLFVTALEPGEGIFRHVVDEDDELMRVEITLKKRYKAGMCSERCIDLVVTKA